jgi:asparagine synthase (glutamine-hydrolysing)
MGKLPSKEDVFRASKKLLHRGPDETGSFFNNYSALCVLRYKVQGITNGAQPFRSSCGQFIVIYNGEIYNHVELRKHLNGKGIIIDSMSDGAVIPDLFALYGPNFITLLNGEFAIAILDTYQKSIHLYRDRFGIRPLFLHQGDGVFVFASEAKAIAELCYATRNLNLRSLGSFALTGFLKNPQTLFHEIEQIPVASFVSLQSNGKKITSRYWDFPFVHSFSAPALYCERDRTQYFDENVVTETLSELLDDAVKVRLATEIPFGVFLSSGLDSSLIAHTASRYTAGPINTFTLRFQESGFDESKEAAAFAKASGFSHHILDYNDNLAVSLFPHLIFHTEGIINSGGPMAFHALAKFAKQHCGVVLGGEGADEVFHGYGFHREHRLFAMLRNLGICGDNFFSRGIFKAFDLAKKDMFPDKELIQRAIDLFGRNSLGLHYYARKGQVLFPGLQIFGVSEHEAISATNDAFSSMLNRGSNLCDLNFLTLIDFETWLESHLLVNNGDRSTMGSTLEVRYPYLDHRLVEYVSKCPIEKRVSLLTNKVLLRKLNVNNFPKAMLKKKKNPFLAPSGKPFFNLEMRKKYTYINELISYRSIKEKGYFNAETLSPILKELADFYQSSHFNKNNSYGRAHLLESIFLTVLSVQVWDEIFIQGRAPESFL